MENESFDYVKSVAPTSPINRKRHAQTEKRGLDVNAMM